MEWYYRQGDQQVGPVSRDDVDALIKAGTLSSRSPVWRDGMPDWAELGRTELAAHIMVQNVRSVETSLQVPRRRTLPQVIVDLFRSGARRIALANELRKIEATRVSRQQELDCIWIAIGTKAQEIPADSDGAATPAPVVNARSVAVKAQDALSAAQQELGVRNQNLARSQEQLASIQKANAERLNTIGAEYEAAVADTKRLDAAARQVAGSVNDLDRKFKAVQADMANTAAGKPDAIPANVLIDRKAKLESERADVVASLEQAKAEAAAARAQSEQKKAILASAKAEASNQESRAQGGVKASKHAVDEGTRNVSAAENALQDARKALGQAICESGSIPSDLSNYKAQADGIAGELSRLESQAAGVQAQIAAGLPPRVSESGGLAGTQAVMPAFSWQRLIPLSVGCLVFGWMSPWLIPDRYFVHMPLIPVLLLAVPAVTLAVLASVFFLRPTTFPRWQALAALLFTAFVGTSILLGFQDIAEFSLTLPLRGPPKAAALVAIVKAIGTAYAWFSNPGSPLQHFLGAIAGVGLCEEATKLLPLFYLVLRKPGPGRELDYRKFLVVGFFSGLGFGIGEALSYRYAPWGLNQTTDGNVLRWFACVPSHAVYTVIDAACLWLLAPIIRETKGFFGRLGYSALAVLAVAIVHGVYDVLCVLPKAGAAIDALSIGLMWLVVKVVAERTGEVDAIIATEDPRPRCLMAWVHSLETNRRSFAPLYIGTAVMILVSLFFSSSEETVRRMQREYENGQQSGVGSNYGNYNVPAELGRMCPECQGTGAIRVDPDGSGTEFRALDIQCSGCRGTGRVAR